MASTSAIPPQTSILTAALGHKYIVQIGIALGMPAQLRDGGMAIFKLAMGGFIQGRRIKSVAAVALYIACRTQKQTNTYMLIDFADVLDVSLAYRFGRLEPSTNFHRSTFSISDIFTSY